MARQRFCKVCKGWHELDNWPHNCMPERNWARSELAGPMIISDSMEPTQHPCNGKMYTSKARFRAETRAHGCVEVGNDVKTTPKPKERPKKAEVRASIDKAFSQAGFGA